MSIVKVKRGEGRGRERVDAAAQGNIHVRLLASLSIVNHGSKLNGSRCIIIPVELQRSIGVEKPSPPRFARLSCISLLEIGVPVRGIWGAKRKLLLVELVDCFRI